MAATTGRYYRVRCVKWCTRQRDVTEETRAHETVTASARTITVTASALLTVTARNGLCATHRLPHAVAKVGSVYAMERSCNVM